VKRVGAKEMNRKTIYPYDGNEVLSMGEHCSATERRADEATRDAMDWLKCEYMQQHIGQTYPGVIASVTGFGLFVALNDIYVEGLIHVTSLPGDYYHYDNVHHRLVGERTGKSYRLGDDIEVVVANVNLDDQKIDFELATGAGLKPKPGKSRTSSRKGGARGGREQASVAKSRAAKRALLNAAKSEESGKGAGKDSGEPGKKPAKKRKPTRKQKTKAKSEKKTSGNASGKAAPKKPAAAKPASRQPRKRKAR
jgi:ribonuclease R